MSVKFNFQNIDWSRFDPRNIDWKNIDWKHILIHPATTHSATVILGLLIGLMINNGAKENRFQDAEQAALFVRGQDSGDNNRETLVLNREYFNPNVWPQINWRNNSNQAVAQLFGETIAKEMAMDIDSVNRGLMTPGEKYGLDYNYCNLAVTTAIRDAAKRIKLKRRGGVQTFVGRESVPALYNGDSLVNYFTREYADKVPHAIVQNPSIQDMENISTGSVVRFGGHSKMFMGFGFVDESGRTFVPSKRGRPVVASGYNDRFGYFDGGSCTVVDIPKIIQYKLQVEQGRHTR